MDFPEIFETALQQTPPGVYHTLKTANIEPEQAMFIGSGLVKTLIAKTNASSTVPLIGTDNFNPCGAMILYNTKKKTAAVLHEPFLNETMFQTLLNEVRSDPKDHVDIHILGMGINALSDNFGPPDDANSMKVNYLTAVLETIAHTENVQLKTFDVYNKPHPQGVLIDTRNGKLIRGSKLFVASEEGQHLPSHFKDFPYIPDEDFDGTAPEFQKPKRARTGHSH